MKVPEAKLDFLLSLVRQGKIATQDAAAELKVSTRHFNRLMKEAKIRRPPGLRSEKDKIAYARKIKRLEAAEAVMSGRWSVEKAAAEADVHPRTIKRHIAKLKNERDR